MTTESGFDPKTQKVIWIPVKQISVIWAQAQRPLNEGHARDIADNFDPEMFGTLALTQPNGKGIYHVIDGHHRKVAVEMKWGPEEKVPCEIFSASDPARAAILFDKINSKRKTPQPIDLFKVRVTAGEEAEVAVNKIVIANGYRIGSGTSDKSISCVAALVAVYRSHGPGPLDLALKVINGTWGADKNAVVAPIIRGYGEFLAEHRHASLQRLRDCIAKHFTPGRLVGAAKTGCEIDRITMSASIKMLLLKNYNHGLRAATQLKPKSRDDKPAQKEKAVA